MAVFPNLRCRDSKGYSIEYEDVAVKTDMENGYVQTRPRHTRKARRTITMNLTSMTQDEKVIVADFWNQQMGGSESFEFIEPTENETMVVRFGQPPKFTYTGSGGHHRWNVQLKFEEV